MRQLAIIGAGSWGTALAIVLSARYERVHLWVHEQDLAACLLATRENAIYLPGFWLPLNVTPTPDLAEAMQGANVVLGVMPSRFARGLYTRMLPYLHPGMRLVSATKGLETGTLLSISQVITQVVRERFQPRIAVLSGPTFAREIAQGAPAAVVIASEWEELARSIQHEFSGPAFRLYTNGDPLGVELGAALKNVIAIGAGICHGLGLGNNTVAALITRGLAEISRLAETMGGQARTLAGLAGMGDLVLTCTGDLSRNRAVGVELAKGRSLAEIVNSMSMIAEGVETTRVAAALARRYGVEMPIVEQMEALLDGRRTPGEAIRELMERSLKNE